MPVGGKDSEQFVISSERQQQQRADATLYNALAHRGATIAVIDHGVTEMDNPLAPQDAFEYAAFRRTERTLLPPIIGKGGLAVGSGKTEPFRLPDEQITVSRPAKGMRLSRIASSTGVRSPGEELMTCNTSAVAVCCSRASRVSVRSRAFS